MNEAKDKKKKNQTRLISSFSQSCPTLGDPMDFSMHSRLPCPSPAPEA